MFKAAHEIISPAGKFIYGVMMLVSRSEDWATIGTSLQTRKPPRKTCARQFHLRY